VVIHRAAHEAVADVDLTGDAGIRLVEQVVLGRSHEPGGIWTGRTRVTRDGVPLLRHTVRSTVLAADGARVIATLVDSARGALAGSTVGATCGGAVVMPLAAGGLLATATGRDLLPTMADLHAALAAATPDPEPAPAPV
jgi:urease accessory protein